MKTILAISACILTFAVFAGTRQLGEIRANDYVVTNEDDLAAIAYTTAVSNKLEIGKQKKLVSGTNIKTVNGQSLLGSGNIVIEGGGGGGGADTNAVHYATDVNGNNTAVSIGSRLSGSAIGKFSVVEGEDNSASGECSHAEGVENVASGYASHAEGGANTASGDNSHAGGILAKATNDVSYVWNGSYVSGPFEYYGSHGYGTYNISPFGGARGLWIGDTNLETHILNAASSTSVTNGGAKAYADETFLPAKVDSWYRVIDADVIANGDWSFKGDVDIGTESKFISQSGWNGYTIFEGGQFKALPSYLDATFAPKLSGRTYDFANGVNFTKTLYTALTNVIQTLGGTVTNPPTFN